MSADNSAQMILTFQDPNYVANTLGGNFAVPPGAVSGINSSDNQIVNWEHYSVQSDFLESTQSFSFTVGDQFITPQLYALLSRGNQPVQLTCQITDSSGNAVGNSLVVFTGFTDRSVITNQGHPATTTFNITGRDQLGRICDCGIDPWNSVYKFTSTMTLGQLVATVVAPYKLTSIYTTDSYNRLLTCGALADSPTQTSTITIEIPSTSQSEDPTQPLESTSYSVTQHVDPTNVFDLTQQQLTTLKAVPHETKGEFLEKHANRFHCHMWATNDGTGVVFGQPDFTQAPLWTLNKYLDGGVSAGTVNNVIGSSLDINYAEMPVVIFAKAMTGSGDAATIRSACCKVNEFTGYDSNGNVLSEVQALINQYTKPGNSKPYIPVIPPNPKLFQYQPFFQSITGVPPCQVYIDETGHHSGTQDQLFGWVSTKMSHLQAKALVYRCTVDDHQQGNQVWKHNTIATVNDESVGIVGVPMWIKSVHFSKSRGEGTHTDLELLPVGVVSFGDSSG